MNRFFNFLISGMLCFYSVSCIGFKTSETEYKTVTLPAPSWKDGLKTDISLLGHRNWIVITDMAYPLQTQAGIKTVYTGEAYMDVLNFVYKEIEEAPHIKAAIYQDRELLYLNEKDAAGIDALRGQMKTLFGDRRTFIPHEELINRLDEVSRKFNVVILKSNLTVPYTSTFFELDCNYWDSAKEQALQQAVIKEK
ncbi:MAG: hypothetical protein LBQ01_01800 [Prevotellaceae bacterium]|nr:hypothetical protein [Prevotellaceae bacterium]